MISIIRLWETVQQLAKTETSGYQDQDEFNRDVAAVQSDIMSYSSIDSASQSWIDIYGPFSKSAPLSIDNNGVADLPEDYYRGRTGSIGGKPCYPITVNQKDLYISSPIRGSVNVYWLENGNINFSPAKNASCTFSYLRNPAEATIILTPVEAEDDDYLVPESGADLEWNENVFNLFVYKMLERLGVEMKDNLAREYSMLGIQQEIAKT